MPDTPITDFSKLYQKMLIFCVAPCGSEISGRIKRLSYPYIFFDASLPYTDKRVPEAEDDFDENEMEDKPETVPDEFFYVGCLLEGNMKLYCPIQLISKKNECGRQNINLQWKL